MHQSTTGIVYVLTNAAMPGLIKIGLTQSESVNQRMATLSRHAGVPVPFECHFAAKVADCKGVEAKLHKVFALHRKNDRREFFEMSPERVVIAISIGAFEDVTPSKQSPKTLDEKAGLKAQEKANSLLERRSKILISQLGIPIGSILTFSRNESIQATVIANDKIDFEGIPMSLTAAALIVLKRLSYKSTTANGAAYWMYDDELLTDRRVRLEEAKL